MKPQPGSWISSSFKKFGITSARTERRLDRYWLFPPPKFQLSKRVVGPVLAWIPFTFLGSAQLPKPPRAPAKPKQQGRFLPFPPSTRIASWLPPPLNQGKRDSCSACVHPIQTPVSLGHIGPKQKTSKMLFADKMGVSFRRQPKMASVVLWSSLQKPHQKRHPNTNTPEWSCAFSNT